MNQSIKTIFTWIKKYSWLKYVEQGHFEDPVWRTFNMTWLGLIRHDFIGFVKDILRYEIEVLSFLRSFDCSENVWSNTIHKHKYGISKKKTGFKRMIKKTALIYKVAVKNLLSWTLKYQIICSYNWIIKFLVWKKFFSNEYSKNI